MYEADTALLRQVVALVVDLDHASSNLVVHPMRFYRNGVSSYSNTCSSRNPISVFILD